MTTRLPKGDESDCILTLAKRCTVHDECKAHHGLSVECGFSAPMPGYPMRVGSGQAIIRMFDSADFAARSSADEMADESFLLSFSQPSIILGMQTWSNHAVQLLVSEIQRDPPSRRALMQAYAGGMAYTSMDGASLTTSCIEVSARRIIPRSKIPREFFNLSLTLKCIIAP